MKENLVENGAYKVQSTYERTRELVEERLGGPFDQNLFTKDLKSIVEEARDIQKVFRSERLAIPGEAPKGNKIPYDFSEPDPVSPF